MRILIEGCLVKEVSKLKRRFHCPVCDCIFEAGVGEYKVETALRNDLLCFCKCPTCGFLTNHCLGYGEK